MPPVNVNASAFARCRNVLFARPVFLVIGLSTVAFCVFAAIDATKLRPNDGTVWLLGSAVPTVLDVQTRSGTPPTPLRKYDNIAGIANQLVRSPRHAAQILGAQQPGSEVPFLVERDGRQLVLPVTLTGFRVADRSYALNVVLAMVYLLIGGLVYCKSANDRPARLFFTLCLCFAVYFMTDLQRSSYFWGDILSRNGGAFARFFLPALFLQFFLVFPERKLLLLRRPLLATLLYLPPLFFYARFTHDQFYGDRGAHIGAGIWLVLGLYYVAGLIALLHSYLSYRDPLLRERVRILTWGTLAAVVPFLVFKVGLAEINSRSELAQLGVVPLAAIPVSFGYCVARYQVLQIDFLVKRSLLFGALSGLLLVGWAAAVLWLGSRLVAVVGSNNPLIAVGVTLFAAAALWPVRNQAQHALENRLYQSRAKLAVLLDQFSREIPGLLQQQALLDHVGRKLKHALNLQELSFYLPQAGAETTVFCRAWPEGRRDAPSLGREGSGRDALRIELPLALQALKERQEPMWIDPREVRRLTARQDEASAPAIAAFQREQIRLVAGGVNLLVPLAVSGRIIGLIALPALPGDETYQLHEVRLLSIVARQTAMQLENTRLYAEELAKQTLEEEMRLARSIQSRLLPAAIPQLPGIQIDAVNLSSKTVSGDYYDVIPRSDGKLALIIADVSGKGMPASLLASNLQAALRAQCDLWDEPGAILLRVNRQLHAATDSRHFATVFLAFFDPTSRRLRYSNGGHDSPIVLTAAGDLHRLEAGGLPLGAFDFGDYAEGEIELGAGDLLLLYTDGLTETRRPDGEDEFGCDRLERFLREHQHRDTAELLPLLEQELQQFRQRRDADDDITLIALKVAAVRIATSAAEQMLRAGGTPANRKET